MKKLLILLFCMASFSSYALEIKGVNVSDSVQVAGNTLALNGAGVRTKMMFKVYVAALYLTEKKSDANAVLSDTGSKRVALHLLRELTAEKLLGAIEDGFKANNSSAEMAAIEPQMQSFRKMLATGGAVKAGDTILLDYSADTGTSVSLNGKSLGQIEGTPFNVALLRVWLGNHPVDSALKKALLGQ